MAKRGIALRTEEGATSKGVGVSPAMDTAAGRVNTAAAETFVIRGGDTIIEVAAGTVVAAGTDRATGAAVAAAAAIVVTVRGTVEVAAITVRSGDVTVAAGADAIAERVSCRTCC